ncbi:site-specific DNA-methyltransferase [Prevotella sp. P5-126]|uniref:site-specific DNA-methyltransferase n=1 Tax=Prevotella sp. P5-126 TaxID=2024216 RepID=UPI0015704D3A|nr:site-specific DNA-methyltransferase [Prevotella sp. P5-126]
MDKLNMQTTNIVDENIKKIGELFPNCLTERLNDEGKPEVAIDFDQLRQELSKDIVEGAEERYQFTWPDKRNAIRLANAPTTDTLRPCREESVDFDNTQNLYIEGDNLQVLKLLRENYLGKVKMIYIDPPYNTGNDFVYNDDFSQSTGEYMHNSGQEDEEGNRLVTNSESNGRFHTDWLNMIYPRLKVAKDLLSEDGVIFISIDDCEQRNMRILCDEIFGESNFVTQIVWQKIHSIKNDARFFSENHEYALIYARNKEKYKVELLPRTAEMNERYKNPDNDPRGPWQSGDLVASGERSNGHFIIISPKSGKTFDVPQGKHWVYSESNLKKLVEDNQIWFGEDGNSFPRKKRFLSDVQDGRTASTIWLSEEVGHNQTATREVKHLFDDNKYFDFPKPVSYIKQMLMVSTKNEDIVLDFFSGSATTAHAVMQLNAEDDGKRKFIMVQLPEATDEKSEANKAGYKNICEIGKERIRRAGKKIKEESPLTTQDLDTGFRVLKLDSSNMQDVYYTPAEFNEQKLFDDNIKPDRLGNDGEDLLFQTMIELGIELSAKIEKRSIAGKAVWSVSDGYLMACFDEEVNETTITEIARQHPYYFVMRDSSLANDQVADNFEQIWEEYSKETVRRIL